MSKDHMRSMLYGAAFICMVVAAPSHSQTTAPAAKGDVVKEIALDDLQGKTVRTTNSYTARFGSPKGEASGGFTLRREIKIGPEARVQVKFTRDLWWDTPNGRRTMRMAGSDGGGIGVPLKGAGPRLFVLEGDSLTMLRVHDIGGHVLKVKFQKGASGLTCSAQSTMAKEVGAGTRNSFTLPDGAKGQVWNTRATSSDCKIQETK